MASLHRGLIRQLLNIHSGHFYSASSSLLLLGSASNTTLVLCWSFTPKRHRQLRFKDLPKVPTWPLERDSNPRPSGQRLRLYQGAATSIKCLIFLVSLTFINWI